MHDQTTTFTTVLAMVHALTRRLVPTLDDPDERDCGAVSIQQVLW